MYVHGFGIVAGKWVFDMVERRPDAVAVNEEE